MFRYLGVTPGDFRLLLHIVLMMKVILYQRKNPGRL
jgi:hypothetical protein